MIKEKGKREVVLRVIIAIPLIAITLGALTNMVFWVIACTVLWFATHYEALTLTNLPNFPHQLRRQADRLLFIGAVGCLSMGFLRHVEGPWFCLYFLALVAVNDTFAYIAGRALGGTKFEKAVYSEWSKGKTWEGALGGIGASLFVSNVAGILLVQYGLIDLPAVLVAVYGFAAALLAPRGDLIESKAKRLARKKDMSRALGPHGGFWDRFDAILFVFATIGPVHIVMLLLFL